MIFPKKITAQRPKHKYRSFKYQSLQTNPKTADVLNDIFGEIHTSASIRSQIMNLREKGLKGMRIEDSGKLAQTGRNLWPEEQQASVLLLCCCATAATSASTVILSYSRSCYFGVNLSRREGPTFLPHQGTIGQHPKVPGNGPQLVASLCGYTLWLCGYLGPIRPVTLRL